MLVPDAVEHRHFVVIVPVDRLVEKTVVLFSFDILGGVCFSALDSLFFNFHHFAVGKVTQKLFFLRLGGKLLEKLLFSLVDLLVKLFLHQLKLNV